MKVIVNLAGGFGNQLFCYSFGYALAKRKNAELIIDTSTQDNGLTRSLELMKLNIRFNHRISYKYKKGFFERAVLNKIRKRKAIGFTTKIYNEINPTIFEDAVFDIQENTYFKGNWQSEKYFINYRDELLEMLTPKEERNVSVPEAARSGHPFRWRQQACAAVFCTGKTVLAGTTSAAGWTQLYAF